MAATFKWQEFEPARLQYGVQPLPNGNNGKRVVVEYVDPKTNSKVPVRWQSPRLTIPFGVSRYDDKEGNVKYSMPQNLEDAAYRAFLEKLDQCNLDAIFKMQRQWFPDKKPRSREVLSELYIPLVKLAKEDKYPPQTRNKCPFRGNQILTRFWNEQREQIASTDVPPHSQAVAVLEFMHLWFIGAQCGAMLECNQAKVYGSSERFDEFAIDDGDEAANEAPQVNECLVEA